MAKLVKVARIRNEGVPIGVAAPLYYGCPCGARAEVPETFTIGTEPETVCECGRVFDIEGYIIRGAPETRPDGSVVRADGTVLIAPRPWWITS